MCSRSMHAFIVVMETHVLCSRSAVSSQDSLDGGQQGRGQEEVQAAPEELCGPLPWEASGEAECKCTCVGWAQPHNN